MLQSASPAPPPQTKPASGFDHVDLTERYAVNSKTKERLLGLMELTSTSIVADFGATASSESILKGVKIKGSTEGGRISDTRKILGKVTSGTVYAVNIDADELEKIRNEVASARESGAQVGNLVTVLNGKKSIFGETIKGGSSIKPGSLDAALFSMVVHHLPSQDLGPIFKSAYEALKPGGRLVILDKLLADQKDKTTCEGENQEANHCTNPTLVRQLLEQAGFTNIKQIRASTVFFVGSNSQNKKFEQWILIVHKPSSD